MTFLYICGGIILFLVSIYQLGESHKGMEGLAAALKGALAMAALIFLLIGIRQGWLPT